MSIGGTCGEILCWRLLGSDRKKTRFKGNNLTAKMFFFEKIYLILKTLVCLFWNFSVNSLVRAISIIIILVFFANSLCMGQIDWNNIFEGLKF